MTDEQYKIMKEMQLDMLEKREKWKLKEKAEKYDKLKEAVGKIKEEIQGISENPDYQPIGTYDYVTGSEDCRKVILEIIDKHLKEVEHDS